MLTPPPPTTHSHNTKNRENARDTRTFQRDIFHVMLHSSCATTVLARMIRVLLELPVCVCVCVCVSVSVCGPWSSRTHSSPRLPAGGPHGSLITRQTQTTSAAVPD